MILFFAFYTQKEDQLKTSLLWKMCKSLKRYIIISENPRDTGHFLRQGKPLWITIKAPRYIFP